MSNAKRNGITALVVAMALVSGSAALADFEQGMSSFKSGKYAEAAAEFQALVDQTPSYDYGFYMLGLSFFKMGKHEEAATNIDKARQINGDKFEYHHALASVYRTQRSQSKALKVLNSAEGLVEEPRKFAFYSLRGFVNADLEKWPEAVADLEQARKAKQSAQVLNYLGKAYFKLGHHDKAVPVLREATKLNPNDATTQFILAESLINLARETRDDARKKQLFTEAMHSASVVRSMTPDDYLAVNLVGKAALGAQDFRAAEQAFTKVLSMKPDYCYAMVNLSKCLIAQERWKDAEGPARDATTCAPRLIAGYESLGYALQKQKRLDESLEVYKKAYDIQASASIRKLMDVVEENIRRREENKAMEAEEQAAAEEARKAQEEYEEALKKAKEWEKKRDD